MTAVDNVHWIILIPEFHTPSHLQKVLFKMDDQGNGIEIDIANLGKTTDEPRFDGWTIDKFR
jgi:hypothetical protein